MSVPGSNGILKKTRNACLCGLVMCLPLIFSGNSHALGCDQGGFVTAGASASSIPESGGATAQFVFTVTATAGADAHLSLQISGTATNGVDYQTLPAQVTLLANHSQVTLTLTPMPDGLTEGTETVTVTIAGSDNICVVVGSPNSATISITDVVTSPPVFTGAASRRVHGIAGTFDLPLSTVTTNPTTEPRQGPAQTIVVTFDKPITAATATITEGTATAGAPTFSGNNVLIGLTGVTDQQYVTLSLTNVASADGGTGGNGLVRVGFLAGDVNQTRVVTLADLGLVNAQLAQPVTASNFMKDVKVSGTLTLADKGVANTNLTRALPAP